MFGERGKRFLCRECFYYGGETEWAEFVGFVKCLC